MTETRKVFHEELAELCSDVVRLSAMASEAIQAGSGALLEFDLTSAERVITDDAFMDALAYDMEERVYLLLARQQPMAIDLRTLVTIVRVVHELERIGDLMGNVAKAARRLYPRQLDPRLRGLIDRMREQATAQLQVATDAFAERDQVRARALADMDDVMDDLQKELFRTIFSSPARDEAAVQLAVQVALVGRYFERIADHAVNVAERVAYMVTGRLHPHGRRRGPVLAGGSTSSSVHCSFTCRPACGQPPSVASAADEGPRGRKTADAALQVWDREDGGPVRRRSHWGPPPAARTTTPTPAPAAPPTRAAVQLTGVLKGSGATFPKGFYEVAIEAFKAEQPGLTIEYPGGGSGTGRQNLQDGVVDFAGSDGLVKDEDKPKYKGEFLYFPTVAAPITVSYNLDVERPRPRRRHHRQDLPAPDHQVGRRRHQGASTPSANLPSTDIVVAHRSDGSGTTENFTKYLVAAAPNTWTLKSGSTVEWPADTQAGNGNAGVASIVKDTAGAIGYVDLSDAKATGLKFATIVNKAGKKVEPTLDAASAALAGATVNPDLSYNPLNADGDGAYPITAPTWILVYTNQTDKAKGDAIKGFLTYILTDGQDLAEAVDYAELPDSLRDKALAQVDKIVVPAT